MAGGSADGTRHASASLTGAWARGMSGALPVGLAAGAGTGEIEKPGDAEAVSVTGFAAGARTIGAGAPYVGPVPAPIVRVWVPVTASDDVPGEVV